MPVSLALQADGTVTVRGQQHIAGFDPAKNTLTWSNYFAAPGVNNFAVLAMGAVSVALAVANTGQAAMATSMSEHSRAVDGAIGSTDSFHKYAAQRFTATRAAGNSVYMLTNVEDGTQKGPGLLKIDLATGEPNGQLLLNDKEPDYRVDEAVGRVFYFKGKNSIVAYQF